MRGRMPRRSSYRLTATAPCIATSVAILLGTGPVHADGIGDEAKKAAQSDRLEEVIVTAQRRSERLIDVPYNISAVSGDDLTSAGAANANDLTKVVAGLGNFSDGPSDRYGQNNFTLRGLNTDSLTLSNKYTAASVATYYGDTPVFYPLLLKDLERVEVLRGPQGTLYGSSSETGAIRFIPKRPSFDKFSGELNVSSGSTQHAQGLNSSADGVANIPLAGNLAVRLSAAYVKQAGYVDDVDLFERDASGVPVPSVQGDLTSGPVIAPIKKGANSWDQLMVRGAMRYQPADWLDLDVSYLHQRTHADDSNMTNPGYAGGVNDLSDGIYPNAPYDTRPGGRYANTQAIQQPLTSNLDLVSGTAAFDLHFADLSSISSYYKTKTDSVNAGDVTYASPDFSYLPYYNYYPRFTVPVAFNGKEQGFTQEVRLVSKGQSNFSYVLGAYYSRQHKVNAFAFNIPGLEALSKDPGCQSAFGNLFCEANWGPQPYGDLVFGANQGFLNKERALFGELSYHITPAWQVTGGARVFKVTQDFDAATNLYWFAETELFNSSVSHSSKVIKLNTSYQFNSDNQVYATYSEGYRRGGANALSTTGLTASLPQFLAFKPDFSHNYEIGFKGRTLDHRLTYTVAGYWITLDDFQFNGLTPSAFSAVFNGKKAKSSGIELEGSFNATAHLVLSGSYALTNTKVPENTVIRDLASGSLVTDPPNGVVIDNPGATVLAGAVLPGVSKQAAMAAIDYDIPMGGDARLLLHANGNYRSSQHNMIAEESLYFRVLPSVFTADARMTYDSGKAWSASVYVTNLTNAVNSTGDQGVQVPNPAYASLLIWSGRLLGTPRTFGAALHYAF